MEVWTTEQMNEHTYGRMDERKDKKLNAGGYKNLNILYVFHCLFGL